MSAAVGRAAERPREAVATVDGRRTAVLSLAAGGVGAALWIVALLLDPPSALRAYLVAWTWALSIALGALCLVMIGWVTGAAWIVVVRRLAEGLAATLPLLAVGVLPLLVRPATLYPWARPLAELPEGLREQVALKDAWLDVSFFRLRALAYLAVWVTLSALLWRASLRGDDPERRRPAPTGGPVRVSAVGLPLFAFTVTFAAFDWLMSLSPEWSSTVFGAYVFAGGMVGALAAMVILAASFRRRGLLRGAVAASHLYALGRLLFAFLVFWAYLAYSQGFIVWIADIPAEARWYLDRWDRGWAWILGILAVGHFLLPFLVLLHHGVKRRAGPLAAVGAWLLLLHWVDVYWLVVPGLSGAGPWPGWAQGAALLMVGGLATAFGAWRLDGHAAAPVGDAKFADSLRYDSR